MSLFVVTIFYAAALLALAIIGSVVLGTVAYLLTRPARSGRKRAVIASALFPFASIAFAAVWFFTYAFINGAVFHRDPGLGDSWETPLPNGYALMMIDTTDQGTVYNPKTQGGSDSVASREDTEFGVRQLQVSGNRIFGARDSGYFNRIGQDSNAADTYFEIDADKGKPVEFKSLTELRQHAAAEGVALDLRSFEAVFGDYRTTWFDYLAGAILLIIPGIAFVALARLVRRIRKSALAESPMSR
jgi:hypothetical protein